MAKHMEGRNSFNITMDKERLIYLYEGYLHRRLTTLEELEFNNYLGRTELSGLEQLIDEDWDAFNEGDEILLPRNRKEQIFHQIISQVPANTKIHKVGWARYWIAASILVAFAGSYYFIGKSDKILKETSHVESIVPIADGVSITLANGKQLLLNESYHGRLSIENGVVAGQTGKSLDYSAAKDISVNTMQTLSNAGGGKFGLTLSDGTEVILDAKSSIKFPVGFNGKERSVTLEGQAFFKVKHNADHPFFVYAGRTVIEDIGTEFNVDAYPEETISKTTLIEGAVKINHTLDLKPGEQAKFDGQNLEMVKPNLETVTAWLQDKLVFYHEPLESILQKVAKVYDVHFVYTNNNLRQLRFNGAVNRNKKLATILNFFRTTGEVDFILEGKTVKVIYPKSKK